MYVKSHWSCLNHSTQTRFGLSGCFTALIYIHKSAMHPVCSLEGNLEKVNQTFIIWPTTYCRFTESHSDSHKLKWKQVMAAGSDLEILPVFGSCGMSLWPLWPAGKPSGRLPVATTSLYKYGKQKQFRSCRLFCCEFINTPLVIWGGQQTCGEQKQQNCGFRIHLHSHAFTLQSSLL